MKTLTEIFKNRKDKDNLIPPPISSDEAISSSEKKNDFKSRFLEKINDDLNMPEAMSVLWEMLKDGDLSSNEKINLAYDFDMIFGLGLESVQPEKIETDIPEEIRILTEKRNEAKKKRDFKSADEIRDEIKQKGYEILDTKDGIQIKKSD